MTGKTAEPTVEKVDVAIDASVSEVKTRETGIQHSALYDGSHMADYSYLFSLAVSNKGQQTLSSLTHTRVDVYTYTVA